jgi:hypothetical protein
MREAEKVPEEVVPEEVEVEKWTRRVAGGR